MSKKHRALPTATLDGVLGMNPCWSHDGVRDAFADFGKGHGTALDALSVPTAIDDSRLWLACHLLPSNYRPSFTLMASHRRKRSGWNIWRTLRRQDDGVQVLRADLLRYLGGP